MSAGLVNAHTHLYSGLAPLGMPAPAVAPTSFVQILERIWWRLDRALDAASLAAAAELYVAEAVVAGDVLQIVLFSSIFGVALMLSGAKGAPMLRFCEGLNAVMFKLQKKE